MIRRIVMSLLFMPFSLMAVEGMWQPAELLDLEADLKAKGLQIPVENISELDKHPMTSLVSLGFCSASFVSETGLVITNHHCAYGAIQHNSTAENNLIDAGFYAQELNDELSGGPGLYVYVTEQIKDVSDQFIDALDSLHGQARFDKTDEIKKAIVKGCETKEEFRCNVRTFHGGLQFYLIKQLQIKDVRLVYAPADSIGKFGGDVDNWIWPRHTGDFAFLRAYVSKAGESVEYSEDNVPYQPATWLTVNPAGLEAGDFAMVLGYPGRTNRHRLSEEIEASVNWRYPTWIKYYSKVVKMVNQESKTRPEVGVKYAASLAGINNYLKNSQGMLDGFSDALLVKNKREGELAFEQWNKENSSASNVNHLANLRKIISDSQQSRERDFYFSNINSSKLLSAANRMYRLAKERDKPDHERNGSYQKRNWGRIKRSMKSMNQTFDKQMDEILLHDALSLYASLPKTERFADVDQFFNIKENDENGKMLSKKVNEIYNNTELDDVDFRMSWFEKSAADFEASDDAFIQLAVDMYDLNISEEKKEEVLDANLQEARMNYMRSYLAYAKSKNLPVYADANSTLRVSYGNVVGYQPKDAVSYAPFTGLNGIVEKYTGVEPFDGPQKQIDLIKAKDYGSYEMKALSTVPVNFLADLDITGGNSGSPTLDANAQLVGLAFDGNYESISSDWVFNKVLTRSIHVDIRYILWVMDKIDNADRLLKEMKVK